STASFGPDLLRHPHRWQREHWLLASCLGAVVVLVSSIIPGFADAHREDPQSAADWTEAPLALPEPRQTLRAESQADQRSWVSVAVQSGQSMADLFQQQGLSAGELHRLLQVEGM